MEGTFLVTGASKGLGRSLAISIAKSGGTVIALARNSVELTDVEAELKSLTENSIAVSCDLSNPSDISNTAKFIVSKFEHLSGIVHNAGMINPIGNMLDIHRSEWERAIQVNLIGVQDLTSSLDAVIGGEIIQELPRFLVVLHNARYTDGVLTVCPKQGLICGQIVWLKKGLLRIFLH